MVDSDLECCNLLQEEILFENTYTCDKSLLKEVYFHVFFKTPLAIVIHALVVCLGIQNLFSIIFNSYDGGWKFFIFPLVFYPVMFFIYRRAVTVGYAREVEVSGEKDVSYTTLVTDTKLIYGSADQKKETDINCIKDAFVTKRFLVLQSKAKMYYIFDKDNFKQGTYEEFSIFLQSKGLLNIKSKKEKK